MLKHSQRLKYNKEYIDLFVLTHTHQDHIGGMKQFIRDNGNDDVVNSYWFNGGRFNLNLIETNKISISQVQIFVDNINIVNRLYNEPLEFLIYKEYIYIKN